MRPEAAIDDARALARSPWFDWAARIGLAAQGVSYLIVAALALMLAFGWGGRAADRPQAAQLLADEPFGRPLLLLLGLGLGCYGAWRLANAILDRNRDGAAKRLGDLGKGVFYGWLAVSVGAIALGDEDRGRGEADKATAGVFDWPGGRWLVFGAAACFGAAAVWNVFRGLTRRFEKDLESWIAADARRTVATLGLVGLSARGVVFGVIAWFLAKAAYEFDAKEAVGLGGALGKLAVADYGRWLLTAVAAGLLAFGLFGLAQARYRDV